MVITADTAEITYNLKSFTPDLRYFLLNVKNLSPVTVKNYLSDYSFFVQWLNMHKASSASSNREAANDSLRSVTETDIREFRNHLIASKLPHRTINRRLSALRTSFEVAYEYGLIKSNPATDVRNVPKKDSGFSKISIPLGEVESNNLHDTSLIGTFARDLATAGYAKDHVSQVTNDLYEFYDIVNALT